MPLDQSRRSKDHHAIHAVATMLAQILLVSLEFGEALARRSKSPLGRGAASQSAISNRSDERVETTAGRT